MGSGWVLVVEDEEDVREVIVFCVERHGHRAVGAPNGQEALALLRGAEPPCVIILDLVMPIMDGWHMLAALRSDPRLERIPVVIASAHVATNMPAGVEAVLAKPFEMAELTHSVEKFCRPAEA
jgi:CheY-like chemotaxis protein